MVVVPDESKRANLQLWLTGFAESSECTLHLFANDLEPTHATVLADLTEADFDGYDPRVMLDGFVEVGLDAGKRATILWPEQVWENEAVDGGPVFGLYVLGEEGELLWVERFIEAPVLMEVIGRELRVRPKFSGKSEFMNA